MGRGKQQQQTGVIDNFAATFGTGRGLSAAQQKAQDRAHDREYVSVALLDNYAGGDPNGVLVRLRGLNSTGATRRIAAIKALRAATNMGLKDAKDTCDIVYRAYPKNRPHRFLTVNVTHFEAIDDLNAQGWIVELAQPEGTMNVLAQVPLEHRQALDEFLQAHGGNVISA